MNLDEFFESIDLDIIHSFVKEGREEDLQLDFKAVSDSSFKNKDDKRNLAKALSGFANSSGGVVIWGVDARKNEDDIDVACEEKPIEKLKLFISKLNSYTGEFVNPIVDGVQHRAIPTSEKTDTGFAASLIPESQSGPHMAKAGEHRYYKRSGDSFYRMEHFDLEDVFGRRPHPKLEFFYKSGSHVFTRSR